MIDQIFVVSHMEIYMFFLSLSAQFRWPNKAFGKIVRGSPFVDQTFLLQFGNDLRNGPLGYACSARQIRYTYFAVDTDGGNRVYLGGMELNTDSKIMGKLFNP